MTSDTPTGLPLEGVRVIEFTHMVMGPTVGHILAGLGAEVVRVEFDPAVIGFRDILEVFFGTHDPTTPDRQGNDVGTQYRSAIFFHTDAQRAEAEDLVAALSREHVFDAPIVTEIVPVEAFHPAEDYHHDYFARNPNQPYCQYVVAPKVAKLRAKFTSLLSGS
jgi:peptide-methionine (S)-S-oxide reductase